MVLVVPEYSQRTEKKISVVPARRDYTVTVSILTRLIMNSSSTGTNSLSSIKQAIWSSIASLVFVIVSSTVSPCETHPESA